MGKGAVSDDDLDMGTEEGTVSGKVKGYLGDCIAICGTATLCCCCVLIVLGLAGLGIAKIVMGAVYLHDCPLEKMVPIFLIVSGCAPILFSGLGRQTRSEDSDGECSTGATICGIMGGLFNLAWLIAGSVWVFGTWSKTHADTYISCIGNTTVILNCQATCNKDLLMFASAIALIDWIFMGFWIVLVAYIIYKLFQMRKNVT